MRSRSPRSACARNPRKHRRRPCALPVPRSRGWTRPRSRCSASDRWRGSDPGAAMNVILRWLLDLLQRFVRTLDWSLCAALFALMSIALAVLYSAGGENGMPLVYAQGAHYAVGPAPMWVLSGVTPSRNRTSDGWG